MRWIGIDPGVSGGAVGLEPDGRAVAWAVGWRALDRRGGRVWRVRDADGGEAVYRSLGVVAAALRAQALKWCWDDDYGLSVEALFGRGPSLVVLAEASGRMLGALESSACTVWRPRSRDWRRRVLGINEARLGAQASERAAVALAPAMFGGLGCLVGDGHVVEAACIALDGMRCARMGGR